MIEVAAVVIRNPQGHVLTVRKKSSTKYQLPGGKPEAGEALVDESAGVAHGVILMGGTTVGRGCEIGAGARVDDSVIFDGVTIEPGAMVRNSIIAAGARIGANARITDCVIGEGATVGARCELLGGMRVWPGVEIPDSGVRFSPDA